MPQHEAARETPVLKNLTIESITENVILTNNQTKDARLRYIMERLVSHLHNFARETRLSTPEWMAGIEFLTAVGKKCTDVRQEFVLLSDTLGLSLLVDSIDHPKPAGSTDGTVLGPYHTHDAQDKATGSSISADPHGEPLLCVCTVRSTSGTPISGVKVDVWESDSHGHYDVQYKGYSGDRPDGRAVVRSDDQGVFWFKAIVPVMYRIPDDGPVGDMLKRLGRHPWRPSHVHFMFTKEGYDHLITALYFRGDPFETSDAVFGVKDSLIVDLSEVDAETAEKYGVRKGTKLLTYDFVLVTDETARRLRDEESLKAMKALGRENMTIIQGLLVPDVD